MRASELQEALKKARMKTEIGVKTPAERPPPQPVSPTKKEEPKESSKNKANKNERDRSSSPKPEKKKGKTPTNVKSKTFVLDSGNVEIDQFHILQNSFDHSLI